MTITPGEGWSEHLLDIGLETSPIDWLVEQPRRIDTIMPQGSHKGHGVPMAEGGLATTPRSGSSFMLSGPSDPACGKSDRTSGGTVRPANGRRDRALNPVSSENRAAANHPWRYRRRLDRSRPNRGLFLLGRVCLGAHARRDYRQHNKCRHEVCVPPLLRIVPAVAPPEDIVCVPPRPAVVPMAVAPADTISVPPLLITVLLTTPPDETFYSHGWRRWRQARAPPADRTKRYRRSTPGIRG